MFDVPKESRLMLVVRSVLFAVSYILFLGSMSYLNPVIALICQQAGIAVTENAVRFLLR